MRMILALVFSLVSLACSAQIPDEVMQWTLLKATNAVATGCSTYDTTNAWDNFIEGFQTATTGYESNVWTGVGTTANIYPAADSSALTTYKPSGACSQALKIVVPTDGTETYIIGNLGAAIDLDTIQTDVYFSLYITNLTVLGGYYQIYGYRHTTTPTTGTGVQIGLTGGGQPTIASMSTGGAAININQNQWYVVKLSYDTAAAADGSSITIYSNGSVVGTDAFTRPGSTDMQYLFFGAPNGLEATETGTLYFDLICVKTN